MVKEWPKPDHRDPIVRVSKPGMEWDEINLKPLLDCLRRELAMRQRVYPKWIAKGSMSENKAADELELMRQLVEFLVHCVFKAVTRRAKETA